jgi:hypothetical protein
MNNSFVEFLARYGAIRFDQLPKYIQNNINCQLRNERQIIAQGRRMGKSFVHQLLTEYYEYVNNDLPDENDDFQPLFKSTPTVEEG